MTDAPSHAEILNSILAARGGAGAFSVEQRAVASAMAFALLRVGDGDMSGTANIGGLAALLPPPRPLDTFDQTRLNNAEHAKFCKLVAKGRGEAYEPPLKPPRSPRTRDVLRLRNLLDRVQARIVAEDRYLAEPTEAERAELRNHISILLSGLNTTVDHALGIAPAVMPAPARALQLLSPPIEAVAIELPANVIPMPQR